MAINIKKKSFSVLCILSFLISMGNWDVVAQEKNDSGSARKKLSSSVSGEKKGSKVRHAVAKKKNKKNKRQSWASSSVPEWLVVEHSPVILTKDQGQKNKVFTQALIKTYTTNPQIHSALRQYYATSESLRQAMSGWRPSIQGSFSSGYTSVHQYGPPLEQAGRASSNPKSGGVSLTQNLFSGGSTQASISASESRIRSGKALFLETVQNVLLSAVRSYLDVWYQRERLKTVKKSETFYKESLDQTKIQAAVGESSTITDVSQAQFAYENSMADRIAAERDLATALAVYKQVVGEEAPDNLELPQDLQSLMHLPESLESFVESAKKYNLQVVAAQENYSEAKFTADGSYGALLPSVDLRSSAQRSFDSSPGSRGIRQDSTDITVNVTVPIYGNGGADWSRVSQAEQAASQKKQDIKVAVLAAVESAKQVWAALKTTRSQIDRYKSAIESGRRYIEGTRQEYLVGERSLLEVLQAESNLVSALLGYYSSYRDYLLNEFALISILGELTPHALGLGIPEYDVNTYPENARSAWIDTLDTPLIKPEKKDLS